MFKNLSQELAKEYLKKIEDASAEQKSEAILEVIEDVAINQQKKLIAQILKESEDLRAGRTSYEKLGCRTSFTEEETNFYEKFKNGSKQLATVKNTGIPETIIDLSTSDVMPQSDLSVLWNEAPAGASIWVTASHSGIGAWGALDEEHVISELSANVEAIRSDAKRGVVALAIPKGIRDLALPFIDKYFMAVLNEAMNDLKESGFLYGNGVKSPIGIKYKLPNAENTVAAKDKLTTLTGFSIKDLRTHKKALLNGGKRKVSKIYVVCNPLDAAEYVEPALYYFNGNGYVSASHTPIEVIETHNCVSGDAFLVIEKEYTFAMGAITITDCKEVGALRDVDVLVGAVNGDGRPHDDNTAVYFDVTRLKEFVPTFKNVAAQ